MSSECSGASPGAPGAGRRSGSPPIRTRRIGSSASRPSWDTLTVPGGGPGRVERERYLERIDGLVYGRDPRNGYFRGDTLLHPRAEARLVFPAGWERSRMPLTVDAGSPDQRAAVYASLADTASWRSAADRFFAQRGVVPIEVRETTVGGAGAVVGEFRAPGGEPPVRGYAAFVDRGSRSIRILALAVEEAYGRHRATLRRFVDSLDRLTDREALEAGPLRLDLLTPEGEATVRSLLQRHPSPVSAEDLALLNGVDVDEPLPAGRTLKWVVGALPPAMR